MKTAISLNHAKDAISLGWSQEAILKAQQTAMDSDTYSTYVNSDLFLLMNGSIVYRMTSYDDPLIVEPGAEFECYSDGSAHGTGGNIAGAGGAIYRVGARPVYLSENVGPGTVNRAELLAIWMVLRALPHVDIAIKIYSDSQYAIGSLTEDWHAKKNIALIQAMRADLSIRRQVRFEHVHGHTDVEGNEAADVMAGFGRRRIKIATEYGYRDG